MIVCQGNFNWGNNTGDLYDLVKCLIEAQPDIDDPAVIAAIRQYEQDTITMLDIPWVWEGIKAVAQGLLMRERLDKEDVERLIGLASRRLENGSNSDGVLDHDMP